MSELDRPELADMGREGVSAAGLTDDQLEYLRQTEGLNAANWAAMGLEARLDALNILDAKIAEVTGREVTPVVATESPLHGDRLAEYQDGRIFVNIQQLGDPQLGQGIVEAVVNECVYAYAQGAGDYAPPAIRLRFQDAATS